jgi:myosin I
LSFPARAEQERYEDAILPGLLSEWREDSYTNQWVPVQTEATKIILRYLAKITRKQTEEVAALEDRVLSSNPLLETFGNAQTLRNNNSSRFGKFIHIYFDANGSIAGASISNYLLEKTRITHQVKGERNYHVFYQLLSGGHEELLMELGLQEGMAGFRYLGNTGTTSTDDAMAFKETKECLTSIGLDEQDQKAVFGMVAAVLHLGNIQFVPNDHDVATIAESSKESVKNACALLGLDEEKLMEAVLNKQIVVNGKSILKSQTVDLAEDKRDALAKMVRL